MDELKVCMFKIPFLSLVVFLSLVFSIAIAYSKDVELLVLANASDVSAQVNEEQLLTLNGFRQVVTSELLIQKLDSELFWNKLEQRKMSSKEEAEFLQNLFLNVSVSMAAPADPKELKSENQKLSGNFKATIDQEKLRMAYLEITTDIGESKLRTFYILSNIDIDKSMTWDDVGVQNPEVFRGAIIASWKKLIEKEIKDFEKVIVLDKDLALKPDYMNPKSIILKWTSTFKKVASNPENHSASYELSAEYVMQNTKAGTVLLASDYPVQKRDFDIKNKKSLSSALASMVYNLLFSQASKIKDAVEASAKSLETSEVEIKIITKTGLTEIFQINSLLQEKFKEIKLTSQMKSFSTDGSSLNIRAYGSIDKILDNLSSGGGKFPLNEQKVLLFNRTDKTFAILPKESNN